MSGSALSQAKTKRTSRGVNLSSMAGIVYLAEGPYSCLMLSLQLQAISPNACTIQRFLARPAAWVGLVSCKQGLGGYLRECQN